MEKGRKEKEKKEENVTEISKVVLCQRGALESMIPWDVVFQCYGNVGNEGTSQKHFIPRTLQSIARRY